MSKPIIRIHDLSDDSIIDREMTDPEYKNYQAFQAQNDQQESEAKAKQKAKAALLIKLGITEEEAALLE